MDITGQVAVVTGAAVGIGRAIAQAVAAAGAITTVADTNAEDLAHTARLINEAGGRAFDVPTDVTDRGAVAALVGSAAGRGDGIRLLVNNAGGIARPFWPDAEPEHWTAGLDLNLRAAMLVTQCALPELQRYGGVVVNTASTAGLGFDAAASPEYAAAKAGLIRFTTTVRVPGVRVNGIAPDWIRTPRAERELAEMTPAERAGAPGWIAMDYVCDQVLRFVADDSLTNQVVVLRPEEPPTVLS
ncbi:MAG TPA: SDR family NAD(P)-dependent oxidoreductase [Jatrophihabitantaceae bacterium]|jgi:3-oxoacyl-[acyl-carrier protein] reductase